jgi:hypothetical protein
MPITRSLRILRSIQRHSNVEDLDLSESFAFSMRTPTENIAPIVHLACATAGYLYPEYTSLYIQSTETSFYPTHKMSLNFGPVIIRFTPG